MRPRSTRSDAASFKTTDASWPLRVPSYTCLRYYVNVFAVYRVCINTKMTVVLTAYPPTTRSFHRLRPVNRLIITVILHGYIRFYIIRSISCFGQPARGYTERYEIFIFSFFHKRESNDFFITWYYLSLRP